jgi:glycosyltransferase involved in cell wall biosynthesis
VSARHAADRRDGAAAGDPIRVVHLLPALGVGGMEHGVVKLCNAHRRQTVRASLCSFLGPDPAMQARLAADVPLHELHRRDGNDPAMVWRLVRLLQRLRPDIVHSHSWGTLVEGYVASRLAGVPRVVHGEHGTLETRRRNVWVQRQIWRRVDRVLAVSSRLAERMAAAVGFPLGRIHTIRNGLDLSGFGQGRRREARHAIGVGDQELVAGTVGRLVPVKAQHLLIEAAARLHAGGVACRVVLVGEGPRREELGAIARRLGVGGAVLFTGPRHDVPLVL